MADFRTPFGQSSTRRYPSSEEKSLGFPCGPADQALFNGMFYRIEAEIGEVISHAGIVGSNADLTQLRKAIAALISAATGGGNPNDYILLSQAAVRFPIFPEIQNTDSKYVVTSPGANTVRLPGGVTTMFRGVVPVTPNETDFSVVASKVYHLRINVDGNVSLNDLSDVSYNPGSLSEDNAEFDSSYNSALVARVVTNSSNVPTITNLVNRHRLLSTVVQQGSDPQDSNSNNSNFAFSATYNWGRTPQPLLYSILKAFAPGSSTDADVNIYNSGENFNTAPPSPYVNRYSFQRRISRDWTSDLWCGFRLEA